MSSRAGYGTFCLMGLWGRVSGCLTVLGARRTGSMSRGANPGTDSQFPANCAGNLVSVGMGLRPAKFHEKPGIMAEAGGKVVGTVGKVRPCVCLIWSMRALRE